MGLATNLNWWTPDFWLPLTVWLLVKTSWLKNQWETYWDVMGLYGKMVGKQFITLLCLMWRVSSDYKPICQLPQTSWDFSTQKNNKKKKTSHWSKSEPSKLAGTWILLRNTSQSTTGWWFQPMWKICSSNWIISPSKGEDKKCLKPPPRQLLKVIKAWTLR